MEVKQTEMTIAEALKELQMILKRMDKNRELIRTYCAVPDDRRLHFDTADNQKKEVNSLIQANKDLLNSYLTLKRRVELSNLLVRATICDMNLSLSEMLIMKRDLAKKMRDTYNALDEQKARADLTSRRVSTAPGEKPPRIEIYYDEKSKNDGIRHWEDLYHELNKRLETINATTPLLTLDILKDKGE